jgi:hypothetical protein
MLSPSNKLGNFDLAGQIEYNLEFKYNVIFIERELNT